MKVFVVSKKYNEVFQLGSTGFSFLICHIMLFLLLINFHLVYCFISFEIEI